MPSPSPRHLLGALVLLLVLSGLGGCLYTGMTPEAEHAHFAPLDSVEELGVAATTHRLFYRRWPDTVDELRAGLTLAGLSPVYLDELTAVELADITETSAAYTFRFAAGGVSTLRLNLNKTP